MVHLWLYLISLTSMTIYHLCRKLFLFFNNLIILFISLLSVGARYRLRFEVIFCLFRYCTYVCLDWGIWFDNCGPTFGEIITETICNVSRIIYFFIINVKRVSNI